MRAFMACEGELTPALRAFMACEGDSLIFFEGEFFEVGHGFAREAEAQGDDVVAVWCDLVESVVDAHVYFGDIDADAAA